MRKMRETVLVAVPLVALVFLVRAFYHRYELAHGTAGQAVSATDPVVPVEPVSNNCASIEYRGAGPAFSRVKGKDWAQVMDTFHKAKAQLLGWLTQHQKEFPDSEVALMRARVESLVIERPPTPEQPDLAWRGIAVWDRQLAGEPIIRVGGGFLHLVQEQPKRALFELTRLIAEGWTPCTMSGAAVWAPVLKCFRPASGATEAATSCTENSWAISTAIAAQASPPGCIVPALNDQKVAACLRPWGSG